MKKIIEFIKSRYFVIGTMIFIIFIINYFVNSKIKINVLFFSDDILIYDLFRNSFKDFLIGNYQYSRLLIGLAFKLVGSKIYLLSYINLFINFFIGVTVFFISLDISKSKYISFLASVAFIVARFNYYSMGQVWGIMESNGVFISILFFWSLYSFINKKNSNKYFYLSLFLYFLLPYAHQRYIVLFPLLSFAIFFKIEILKKEKIRFYIFSIGLFLIHILINYFLYINNLIRLGTNGQDIQNTFQFGQFIKYFLRAGFNVLGFNKGDGYLFGMPFDNASIYIKIITFLMLGIFLFILFLFIKESYRIREKYTIKNLLMFLFFIIGLNIGCSTSIRLEMRWIFAQYVVYLFLLGYMFFILKKYINLKYKKKIIFLFILIFFIIIVSNLYYRKYFNNIYFWGLGDFYNSFYAETYGKYGDIIWNKKIIIIDDKNILSQDVKSLELDVNRIMKIYKKDPDNQKINLIVLKELNFLDKKDFKNKYIVLGMKTGYNNFGISPYIEKFIDITKFFNKKIHNDDRLYIIEKKDLFLEKIKEKNKIISGLSGDNWVYKTLNLKVKSGDKGLIILKGFYPKKITGREKIEIFFSNGIFKYDDIFIKKMGIYKKEIIKNNIFEIEIKVNPNSVVDLTLKSNFAFQADPPDVRKLSFILKDIEIN